MQQIEEPMAEAVIRWLGPEEGGRRTGPPTAAVYMSTATLAYGDESEVQPGWPASAEVFSVLIQRVEVLDDGRWRCLVGFLVPDLARPWLHDGAQILVLEGPRLVASGRLVAVFV
ncbi:hypothetical protein GCM10009555_051120 [Acrocarpospora macrocephala]|uniref:Uncharacterized protein n=1 Tax=Acrocarpospora macrocephala TaxID=150177 RepID=A0A5M3WY29_9ACTN|nr:hypothetical protein Amac_079920 [Acrocarpospora macrocephala]